jgi:hypothetical protein
VAEARELIEQARAAKAAAVAAEAEAAAAVEAVEALAKVEAAEERLRLEEELAALTRRTQQVQAQLGVPPAAPAPHPDMRRRISA